MFSKWRPSAILDFKTLYFLLRYVAFVGMPFCFLVQNFSEIRQSDDELWPKNNFQDAAILNFKISIFGHVTAIGFNIYCSVPNFIEIGQFCTEIWRFNDIQNGGRPPSWILKICIFCPVSLVNMPFVFIIRTFAEIGQSVDE